MIAIVDYGMGNLRSVEKALLSVGARARVTSSAKDIFRADKIVLPGVGAFKNAMDGLRKRKLVEPIVMSVSEGKPYLGLCLGLQLLFEESEEFGVHKGFGILKGRVKRFRENTLKIPHMGWNQVELRNQKNGMAENSAKILKGIPDRSFFYFVHSYYVAPEDKNVVAAKTQYGIAFASIVAKDNVFACQFHPEKSQKAGLKLLENFAKI